jgi:hypothetical protein
MRHFLFVANRGTISPLTLPYLSFHDQESIDCCQIFQEHTSFSRAS